MNKMMMSSMLIPIAILVLLFSSSLIFIIGIVKKGFKFHWLLAVTSGLIVWVLILFSSQTLPQAFQLLPTHPMFPNFTWPVLIIDQISWPFALAISSLTLSVVLTDIARLHEADWSAWAGSLSMSALGLLAVVSGNPLTLIFAWTAIDVAELLVLMKIVLHSSVRERIMGAFSVRVLGSVLLIFSGLVVSSQGLEWSFDNIFSQAYVLVFFATGLRLGVLPLHLPYLSELPLRRGFGTISRLVPSSAGLVLLPRIAEQVGEITSLTPFIQLLLSLIGFSAIFGAITWVLARDELDGRPAWILGMASLTMAGALLGKPAASLAWGVGTVFSGGIICLTSYRSKRLIWLPLIGLLMITMLPFTPTYNGNQLFINNFQPLSLLALSAHAIIMVGYLRYAIRQDPLLMEMTVGTWLIYPLGISVLITSNIMIGILINPGLSDLTILGLLPGVGSIMIAVLLILASYRVAMLPERMSQAVKLISSVHLPYLWMGVVYRWLGQSIEFLTGLFEGEGGFFWALLFITILLTFVSNVF